MRKIIAFDQDDTLNVTKQPVPDEMARLLTKLSETPTASGLYSGRAW